jgi:O-antigen/teichoic acid export membrane protein
MKSGYPKEKKQNLKKDYLWNLIGVLAQNAISPILLIVVTRLNGIHSSGMFSFAFSLAIIFWAIGMWGGRTFQVSDVKGEFPLRSYVAMRILLAALIVGIAYVFVLINGYDTSKSAVIVTLVALKGIESIADALYGILQAHNRLYIAGRSLLIKAATGFLAFVVIDVVTADLLLSCISLVTVNLLLIGIYDMPRVKPLENIRIPISQIRLMTRTSIQIMWRTAPVFAVLFLSMFTLNIPRYFVDRYHGAEIGYFGILAMPITLIALVMSFILQPNVVRLSRMYAKQKYYDFQSIVIKLAALTAGIGAVILVVTAIIGVPALQLIFGLDFSKYRTALLIIVAGAILNALVSIYINILVIIRHFKGQFYVLLFTNLALVGASMVVVQERGLLGGVTLFTLFNLVQALMLFAIYKGILRRSMGANTNPIR